MPMMIMVMGPVTKLAWVAPSITTMAPSKECSILPALGIPHGQSVLLATLSQARSRRVQIE
jgi:hypothetical protein